MKTSSSTCLLEKSCVPCQGGTPPLDKSDINRLLEELQNNWKVNQEGHLFKSYIFKDFKESMDFANKVAALADEERHHPNLEISWGSCNIEIWTHKINGLSESDFILAAKINILTLNEERTPS
jgi:4a-hydroxytetrahydrobiopterin dehydratase